MRTRTFKPVWALIGVLLLLVACGNDRRESSTPEPTRVPVATLTANTTSTPTEDAAITEAATATEIATASGIASPEVRAIAPRATPIATVTMATPVIATPITGPASSPVATPASDTPAARAPIELTGSLTLQGRDQVDYVIGADGCVGIGEFRSLKPGAQVVVRDATGTVTDVAELESVTTDDTCEWVFAINAPSDGYFSVTIPMVTEVWFNSGEADVESGHIELVVP